MPRLAHRTEFVRGSAIRDLLSLTVRPEIISLAGGLPAPELTPTERIRRATITALDRPNALQYCETAGVADLRDAIAAHDRRLTGVTVDPASLIVTHGSQQALSLLASVLLDPGDVVVVDAKAYVGALQVFSSVGARAVTVPIDSGGSDVGALRALLEDGLRPQLVHTVSNFHNPTGATLTAARRVELSNLAERYDFWIVEDDPYRDIWFDAPAPAPIPGDHVIRLGSVSKILAPALRVGWMTAPPMVRNAVETFKQGADLCGSSLTHLVAAELLADEQWLDGHLATLRRSYGGRAQALGDSLRGAFGDDIDFETPTGGLFLWVRSLADVDFGELLPVAVDHGVAFVPGSAFDSGSVGSARLCFATANEGVLGAAVERLSVAVRQVRETPLPISR